MINAIINAIDARINAIGDNISVTLKWNPAFKDISLCQDRSAWE